RLNPEEAGKTPERKNAKGDESETASPEIAARQHTPQFVLAAAENFIQVWRRRARRLWSSAPRALAARAPGPTAALIGPRHCIMSPAPAYVTGVRRMTPELG